MYDPEDNIFVRPPRIVLGKLTSDTLLSNYTANPNNKHPRPLIPDQRGHVSQQFLRKQPSQEPTRSKQLMGSDEF